MIWQGLRSWWQGRSDARAAVVPEVAETVDFDCPTLSKLIRAACRERETTVWWVVVLGSSASVYAMPAEPPSSAASK